MVFWPDKSWSTKIIHVLQYVDSKYSFESTVLPKDWNECFQIVMTKLTTTYTALIHHPKTYWSIVQCNIGYIHHSSNCPAILSAPISKVFQTDRLYCNILLSVQDHSNPQISKSISILSLVSYNHICITIVSVYRIYLVPIVLKNLC